MFCLGNPAFTWSDFNRISVSSYSKYCCTLCSYSTSHKNDFAKHKVVHTGERPFVCDVCDTSFPRKDSMKRHLAKVHGKKMWSLWFKTANCVKQIDSLIILKFWMCNNFKFCFYFVCICWNQLKLLKVCNCFVVKFSAFLAGLYFKNRTFDWINNFL